jgi:hypothetical protein
LSNITFQQRVEPWLLACFGEQIAADTIERNHRFLEEALELVQACGCTQSEAHQLVDYVFGRPVGEVQQEAGGVMVTLAALCRAQGLSMHEAGEKELARIWTKVEAIRAKQAAKPKHSPLPGQAAALAQQAVPARRIVVSEAMHVAACKVLLRAHGLDGLPQRMLDAMLAAAPADPHASMVGLKSDLRPGVTIYDLGPSLNPDSAISAKLIDMGWTPPSGWPKRTQAALAQQAVPQMTGCNCRWDGGTQVQWCELHLAHKEAIHDWAERAKTAEAKLAAHRADEINRLRNVIQAACSGGLDHMIERWKVLFPDAPVPTVRAAHHDDGASEAGHAAAAGHLAALLDEAQRILADLHQYAIDLQDDTLGGRSERGEVPIMDLAEDWLAARPDLEPQEPQMAAPQAEQRAYSIDADPEGIRARTDDAIVGALALGQCNQNPAPEGHWLKRFWDYGREAQQWRELFWATARALGCLPSRDVNANAHVFTKAEAMAAQQAEEREPLTDEQIEVLRKQDDCGEDAPEFARIIRIAERDLADRWGVKLGGIGKECA